MPAEGFEAAPSGAGIETAPLAPSPADSVDAADQRGSIVVKLPADAKLIVNGRLTSSVGDTREFVSNGLEADYEYPYSLQAVVVVNGREIVQNKNVKLKAGEKKELLFDLPVETNLTVMVPEGADIVLAGSRTGLSGTERNFLTTRLKFGETWKDYKIVVSVDKDGKKVTKEQVIELKGGDQKTLTFDFENDADPSQQVAAK